MKKIKNFRIQIFLLLAVMLCLAFIPGQLQAGGTDNSDKANNLFVYADDVNGDRVLLKVIPLSTLKGMMHGQDGTADSTYYGSFIDSYPTPTYCEGKGVTITELLDYTFAETSVADEVYFGEGDRLYFYCSDGASINYTYDELLDTNRYYFPQLYNNWDAEEGEISDVDAVLDDKYEMSPYLAVESLGGRVLANTGGNNISGYVADNGGVVTGCLRNDLEDTEALRLVLPQTEEDIEESEPTYGDIKKWVYKVRLRENGTSPITSLGTVSDPTCTFTLSGDTLTITMNCADSSASIYYSKIGGYTKTPVNLYTGPITVDHYDPDEPFTLGVVAVREGYADSAAIEADSANISDDPDDPSFVYALAADTEDIETGEAFTVAATLRADKDYTLYGAEYRIRIPATVFSVGAVSAANGWEYGTATAGDDTIVTFTYLNTDGQAVAADTPLDIGSISLTPLQAGTATISVSEAIVTKAGALPYNSVTAEDLTLTVEAASQPSDVWDGTADTSWYDVGNPLTGYTITTPEQLAGLASLVNAGNSFAGVTFTLANDITLNSESSTTNWTPIGTASVTVGSNREAVVGSGTPFAGIFDGAGYAVNGLYISSPANMQGLFGYLTGTVKDLSVNGRVYSTAIAVGEYEKIGVGAVVAFNHGGTIADVINNAIVDASNMYFVGGIAGYNLNGTITRSANLADVTGFQCVGGIAGRNGGTITYTYNTGKVDGINASSKNGVGGIAGKNGNHNSAVETGIIDSCYNTGTVGRPGQKWVGGIAGFQNNLSSTKNCYDSGTIVVGAGRYAPIIGQEEGASSNNYSLNTLSADTNQTVIGIKLTDTELKAAAPLLGGAFVNDTAGGGYPLLFWQSGLNLGIITVNSNIANGVVTAPAQATEGNTVTVTVTPSEGYRLIMDSLTYTVVGQDPVVISVAEGVYSFVMPAADVTVTAEFESIPVSNAWDGTTIDVSWYNTTDTTFEISTPAQLMGLAAIVNGTYNNEITTVIGDDEHNKIVDGYGSHNAAGTLTASWHFGRDDFEGKTVKLTTDLDIGGVYNSADGTWSGPNYMPIGGQYLMDVNDSTTLLDASFNGTFDGQGHKVYNINCNRYTSLGYSYSQSVGGIIGRLGIHDNDVVNGWNTLASHPTVKNVIVDGYVYGMRSVGGIVGKTGKTNGGAVIENCINLATVKSTDSKGLGGIAGAAWNGGVINNCANFGAITSLYNVGGGISGSCEARISNCYNVGYVQGGNSIGYNNGGASATNCYYLEGSASISGGLAGTEMATADSMKTADFLALLNGDTRAWVLDSDNLLGGYPVLRIMTADSSTLTGITKESDPTKLAYIAGETFNTSGLVIWANYSDGTREKLTDYTISKTGPLALGDTSITVSGAHDGQNYSYTFDITVTAGGLASIAVTTPPTNLLYAQGECFDPAGMVVKATFASGTVTTLTSADYILNPDSLTPLTAATTKITVSYTYDGQTVTADIPVTVLNTAAPQAVDGVYQISSVNDLLWFANRVNTGLNLTINGILTQDIDTSSLTWKPIGSNKAKYAGHFDGNHQKITINLPGTTAYSGLFGYLAAGGMIENLTVAGTVSGGNNTGGVVGYLDGATISGCTNMATVNGVQYVGGIAGNTKGAANILNCTNTGTITSVTGHTVGGIAGNGALTGSIENCSNSGTISATNNAGGIVGNAYGAATILKCFNSGSVTGTSTDTIPSAAVNSAGGIAGFVYAAATIDQCYNSGPVGGGVTNSGGIAGYLNDANSKVTNSYNVGSVTNSSTSANAAVGGIVGYLKNTGGFVQNCYNTGTLSLTASASNYLAGVIGYAGVITHVSNNYYLNTTATQATGLTVSTDANAQAKTSSGMRAASFVTSLGNLYQLGPIYPALSWEKVVVTDEDVDINDGSPVEIGSVQDTTNIVLGNTLVTAIGAANDVSLQLTTSNGEFTFDAGATDGIMSAAGDNDIVFRALQLTESDDPAIQALIDDDALVFDFSLTAGGNPIFTEGSSGMVSIRIPYELGSGDPGNIKVYLVNGGVKTPVSATYDNGYIIFSVEHFSIYSIEYQGLKIWAEFDGANTHFNGSDQVTVKIYARGDEAVTYGSYQADVDFNSAQLTFNSSASAMEDGNSYMNLSAPGKVQIGYSSSESIPQNLSTGGTLLATLVFDVQPVTTDASTGSIGISNANFEAGGSAAQDANIGADLGYTLHNIRLTFQAGNGTTLTTTYAYVKYHEAGLYTDATYTTSINVPVPAAASGYRLAADSESNPLWKDASGTGYTSADIAAGTFTAGVTFTAQASRSGHSSGSGGNTSKKDVEEDVEEDIIEEDVQEDDSSPVKSFTDIQENNWYYEAVEFVVDRGLFTGISSTAFEPQTTMSRDMLVTVLYRLEGEPVVGNAASSLSDVNVGSWYANAVAWATANGIITGYDSGKFGPKDPVTREQLLAILYRYSSLKGYDISASSDLTGFTDSGEIKDYALIPFKWGTGNGLIDGKGAGILDPAGDATRAEVATILMRFINIIQ